MSIRTYVRTSVPSWASWQALRPLRQAPLASPQALLACPQAPMTSPQAPLAGPQTPMTGPQTPRARGVGEGTSGTSWDVPDVGL